MSRASAARLSALPAPITEAMGPRAAGGAANPHGERVWRDLSILSRHLRLFFFG